MAIKVDRSKVAQKAAEEAAKANRGPKTAMLYWKPKQGQNSIRVMPPWTDDGVNAYQFWRECYVHWSIGPDENNVQHFSCPKQTPGSTDTECPICDEYDRLRASSDPADKEAAKGLRAKQRSFSNIIDLADPLWKKDDLDELKANGVDDKEMPKVGSPKVQVYTYGPTVWKQLLDIYTDNVDFCDPLKGHNIFITREGKDINTEYRVRPDVAVTRAPFKTEPPLWNLDALMPFRQAVEMKAILEGVDPQEARKLGQAAAAAKQLEAGSQEAPAEETPAEGEVVEETPAEEVVEETAAEEVVEEVVEETPEEPAAEESESNGRAAWLAEDGTVQPPEGYPTCFSNELDPGDAVCNSQCEAFGECQEATEYKAQMAAAAEAAKPKRQPVAAPKPALAPAKPVAVAKPVIAAKPAAAPAKPVVAAKPVAAPVRAPATVAKPVTAKPAVAAPASTKAPVRAPAKLGTPVAVKGKPAAPKAAPSAEDALEDEMRKALEEG